MKNKVVSMGRAADRSSGREIATKSIKRVIALIFGLLLLINVQGLMATPSVIYVNVSATGANNCSSWSDAFTSLQSALNVATFGYIWVAKGTYYPSSAYSLTNSSRYYHSEMIDEVQIMRL